MPYQRQILLSNERVPRVSIMSLSAVAHLVAIALIVVLRHSGPQIVPEKYAMVQTLSGSDHVTFNPPRSKPAPTQASLLHLPRAKRQKPAPDLGISSEGTGVEALRGKAKVFTAGLMADFKFRQMYGFSPGDYKLAIQTSGVLPVISATELPTRYEQYLVVEVTIDTDGRVADARVVTVESSPRIEQKLLSAIREFKYIPAKRDGSPIPCQVDLVIHIPS
jgi:TonB family protein